MAPLLLVLMLVAIVVVGGIAREFIKSSKENRSLFSKDMEDLKSRMCQLESDMAKLNELVVDTIIEQE